MIENYMNEDIPRYDRQYAEIFGTCAYCGGEIYAGEEYTEWNGNILCCDDCILAWAKEECYTMRAPRGGGYYDNRVTKGVYEEDSDI